MKKLILTTLIFSFLFNNLVHAATGDSEVDSAISQYSDHFKRMINLQGNPGALIAAEIRLSDLENALLELGITKADLEILRLELTNLAKLQISEDGSQREKESELIDLANKLPNMNFTELYLTISKLQTFYPHLQDSLNKIMYTKDFNLKTNSFILASTLALFLINHSDKNLKHLYISSFDSSLEKSLVSLKAYYLNSRLDILTSAYEASRLKIDKELVLEMQKQWLKSFPKENISFFSFTKKKWKSLSPFFKNVLIVFALADVFLVLGTSTEINFKTVMSIIVAISYAPIIFEAIDASRNDVGYSGNKFFNRCINNLKRL